MKKIICLILFCLLLTAGITGCERIPHRCPYNNDQYYHVSLKLLISNKNSSRLYYGVIPIEDYNAWKEEKEDMLHLYYICSHADNIGVNINKEKIINTLISQIKIYDINNLPWGCFE